MSVNRPEYSWQREEDIESRYIVTDPLCLIYNEGQWRLNKVSPLCNFQYTTLKLKQYASKIRQSIVSVAPSNSSVKYKVEIKTVPGLKYSEEDCDGIIIKIASSHETNKSKVAYVCLLFSWGVSSQLQDASHLPYMLEKGEIRLGTAVKSTLQTIFDCNINQYSFTQHHLLEFGFKLVAIDPSCGTEQFVLSYNTPNVDIKDKLSLKFNIEDMKIIWSGIRKEANNESEAVSLAYQILQNQIFYSMKLDVTVLDLCEITLPKADIKANGMVKLKTREMVNLMFIILNNISDIPLKDI